MDERIKTLAKNLVGYSCGVKQGDKVYINYTGPATEDLARQLVKEVYAAGGLPFVHNINPKRPCTVHLPHQAACHRSSAS